MKKQQLHNLSWAQSVCSQSQQLVLLGMRSGVCPASYGSASSPPLLPRAALLHTYALKHILKLLIPPSSPKSQILKTLLGKQPRIPPLLWTDSLVLAPDSSGCTIQAHPWCWCPITATWVPRLDWHSDFTRAVTHILGGPGVVLCRP